MDGIFLIFFFVLYLAFFVFISALTTPLPIGDIERTRYRSLPTMTILLIIVNCIVWIFLQAPDQYALDRALSSIDATMSESEQIDQIITGLEGLHRYVITNYTFGFRGDTLRDMAGIGAFTTFTSMFMHGDLFHLLFNMIYLWTFGGRIEDACGPWRYLLFYLLAGMTANIASGFFFSGANDLPGIGASGAISGILGAYLLLFPGKTLMCLWGVAIPFRWVWGLLTRKPEAETRSAKEKLLDMEMNRGNVKRKAEYPWWSVPLPAWFLLITYVVRNVWDAYWQLQQTEGGGVNYLAHVGGLVAGLLILLFVRKDVATRWMSGRAV